jgi:sporulation protein YlmC with PRC-barrel domain
VSTHDFATLSLLGDADLTVAKTDVDIRGRTVRDSDGKELGKIGDLLIDPHDLAVHLMRVESGGFLGVGESQVFIPIEAIARITDIDVWIDQSNEHVGRERRYEPHLVTTQKYFGDVSY